MKRKVGFGLLFATAILVAFITARWSRTSSPNPEPIGSETEFTEGPAGGQTVPPEMGAPSTATVTPRNEQPASPIITETPVPSTNKLERLNLIRERFIELAAGDPTTALREAKALTDDTERETALLALVTQWTQGELGPAQLRARAIAAFGLEAGLGMELTRNPELLALWANELTEGRGRTALLRQTANSLVTTDPAAAFALGDEFPAEERQRFLNSVFASWGGSDTEAALRWAEQLPEPERAAAVDAIRTSAPVGIGAALSVKDGYPVINDLIPGSPAELSGQIRKGDRIVAMAQGDNAFVDARDVPLEKIVQMVRGAPSTLLQLQIVSADAPANSLPRTVSLLRDQVKFKRVN